MYFCLYLFFFTWPLWKKLVKTYLLNENVGDTTAKMNKDETAEKVNDKDESAQEKAGTSAEETSESENKAAEVVTQAEETETSDHDKKNV